jgi:hypothetical protein
MVVSMMLFKDDAGKCRTEKIAFTSVGLLKNSNSIKIIYTMSEE